MVATFFKKIPPNIFIINALPEKTGGKIRYINNPIKGFRIVRNDNKYGVIDELLEWRLPIVYNWIELVPEGFIVRKGAEQMLLATDGKTILQPFVFDDIDILTYRSNQVDSKGYHVWLKSNCNYYRIGGKYGLMLLNGEVITPAIYDDVNAIDRDLFKCEISGQRNVVVNIKGETVK